MFSGIVEGTAIVEKLVRDGDNLHLTLKSPFSDPLTIDQSIAHNGVCLTVVALDGESYTVTAVEETLKRSNLGMLKEGDLVNVERSMKIDSRLDGHIVQGHVDCTAKCTMKRMVEGSHYYRFDYQVTPEEAAKGYCTVEKGSCCINGVSLTVFNCTAHSFEVTIIPYTFENTNFKFIEEGTVVNIEFDIIGKYIARLNSFK